MQIAIAQSTDGARRGRLRGSSMSNDPEDYGLPCAIGDMIAERYRIEGMLGCGAMGIVLAARHLDLDLNVAIKVMHARLAADHELSARFLREAKVLAKVRSEHVARVTDFGRLAHGVPFFVMEHLDGVDLESHLRANSPLPISDAIAIGRQIAMGLRDVHAVGVVHRDLKPANLFLTAGKDGRLTAKVLDFGISKIPVENEAKLTSVDHVIGSPLYMSPEQMWGPSEVDLRSDLWSLGIILFEMLVGDLPFKGRNIFEVGAVASAGPPSLRQRRSEIPDDLEAVVHRCLAPSPDERYQSAQDLLYALDPCTQSDEPRASAFFETHTHERASLNPRDVFGETVRATDARRANKNLGETALPLITVGAARTHATRAKAFLLSTRGSLILWALTLLVAGWLVFRRTGAPGIEAPAPSAETIDTSSAPADPSALPVAPTDEDDMTFEVVVDAGDVTATDASMARTNSPMEPKTNARRQRKPLSEPSQTKVKPAKGTDPEPVDPLDLTRRK